MSAAKLSARAIRANKPAREVMAFPLLWRRVKSRLILETAGYANTRAKLAKLANPLELDAYHPLSGVEVTVGRNSLPRTSFAVQPFLYEVIMRHFDSAYEQFVSGKLDALAGLRPRLDLEKLTGARIIDGRFTSVQQAIGTPRKNMAGAAFLREFVEEAKASGLVARLIERYNVRGLSVPPPA